MEREVADFKPLDAAADAETIIARIDAAGIVGMGGGGYATVRKLREARTAGANFAIGNGMASEPDASADTTLLREHFVEVAAGLEIVRRCLDDARMALAVPPGSGLPAPAAEVRIPFAGDERRLATHFTHQPMPNGGTPADLGVVVLNVATLFAIFEAVTHGRALRRRLVTVGGADQWLAIGTPLAELAIAEAGELRVNGPLTGQPAAPNAVVEAHTFSVGPARLAALPCIRCGWCVPACPESLDPVYLHDTFLTDLADQADEEQTAVFDCIECGACTAACPSGIDLVNEFRALKDRTQHRNALRERADAARARSAARTERLARQAQQEQARRAARLLGNHRW